MKVGLFINTQFPEGFSLVERVPEMIAQVRAARDAGFASLWFPQGYQPRGSRSASGDPFGWITVEKRTNTDVSLPAGKAETVIWPDRYKAGDVILRYARMLKALLPGAPTIGTPAGGRAVP